MPSDGRLPASFDPTSHRSYDPQQRAAGPSRPRRLRQRPVVHSAPQRRLSQEGVVDGSVPWEELERRLAFDLNVFDGRRMRP